MYADLPFQLTGTLVQSLRPPECKKKDQCWQRASYTLQLTPRPARPRLRRREPTRLGYTQPPFSSLLAQSAEDFTVLVQLLPSQITLPRLNAPLFSKQLRGFSACSPAARRSGCCSADYPPRGHITALTLATHPLP